MTTKQKIAAIIVLITAFGFFAWNFFVEYANSSVTSNAVVFSAITAPTALFAALSFATKRKSLFFLLATLPIHVYSSFYAYLNIFSGVNLFMLHYVLFDVTWVLSFAASFYGVYLAIKNKTR